MDTSRCTPGSCKKNVPEISTWTMAMCLLGTHLCMSVLDIQILVCICAHTLHRGTRIIYVSTFFVHLDVQKYVHMCCMSVCAWVPPTQ